MKKKSGTSNDITNAKQLGDGDIIKIEKNKEDIKKKNKTNCC